MVLEQVAFDIETTGFDVADVVTTVGFAVPLGVRVFVQAGDADVTGSEVEAMVRERTDAHVVVSVHESEAALLQAVGSFAAERFRGADVLLVGRSGTVSFGDIDAWLALLVTARFEPLNVLLERLDTTNGVGDGVSHIVDVS